MTLFDVLRWGQLIAQSGERGNLVLSFVLRPSIVLSKVLSKKFSLKVLLENMTIMMTNNHFVMHKMIFRKLVTNLRLEFSKVLDEDWFLDKIYWRKSYIYKEIRLLVFWIKFFKNHLFISFPRLNECSTLVLVPDFTIFSSTYFTVSVPLFPCESHFICLIGAGENLKLVKLEIFLVKFTSLWAMTLG